jgi:hypothetical protein
MSENAIRTIFCRHLHDGCQPPIVHQNFEPSVVLLNSTLVVHISESGLASLASKSASQVKNVNDYILVLDFLKGYLKLLVTLFLLFES